jgi:glycosyltransferase involved in cell wall biosynthesis
MKILCFLSGSILSGKEYVGLHVIQGWLTNGHQVEVAFVGWHDGRLMQKLEEMGVKPHPIKLGWYYLRQIKWSLDSLINYLPAVYKYRKIQKTFLPDIIYVDSYRQIILLTPFLNKKVFFHVHDPHAISTAERTWIKLADKKVYRYIAVSHFIKNDLITAGIDADKVSVIHNGTVIQDGTGKHYIPEGILRIGIAGLIIDRKGHEDLLTACALLPSNIQFKLLIYGNGDADVTERLKLYAKEKNIDSKIIWMGYENDKQRLYDSIDIVVAPTRNDEPFALVALEAGAHSVPVIATKSGGFPESIIDGETGCLVDKESPQSIADAIILLNSKMRLQKMGTAAKQHIAANFSLQKMQHATNELIVL